MNVWDLCRPDKLIFSNIVRLNPIADFEGNGTLFQVAVLYFSALIMGDYNTVSASFTF